MIFSPFSKSWHHCSSALLPPAGAVLRWASRRTWPTAAVTAAVCMWRTKWTKHTTMGLFLVHTPVLPAPAWSATASWLGQHSEATVGTWSLCRLTPWCTVLLITPWKWLSGSHEKRLWRPQEPVPGTEPTRAAWPLHRLHWWWLESCVFGGSSVARRVSPGHETWRCASGWVCRLHGLYGPSAQRSRHRWSRGCFACSWNPGTGKDAFWMWTSGVLWPRVSPCCGFVCWSPPCRCLSQRFYVLAPHPPVRHERKLETAGFSFFHTISRTSIGLSRGIAPLRANSALHSIQSSPIQYQTPYPGTTQNWPDPRKNPWEVTKNLKPVNQAINKPINHTKNQWANQPTN